MTDTMEAKQYFDKNGIKVTVGDILFYSEDDGSHNWHYADQIVVVILHDGLLKSQCKVVSMNDGKEYVYWNEPIENCVSLKYGQAVNCADGTLIHYTKIGAIENNSHMLTPEYAEKISPLSAHY